MGEEHQENGHFQAHRTTATHQNTFKSSNITFCISIAAAVLAGIVIQITINKILHSKPESLGNNLFSKPPRQQGLVRFPSDVSWFSSTGNGRGGTVDESHMLPEQTVTSHDALNARTIQKVKKKLKVSGELKVE